MRKPIIWFTLFCFITTQTAASSRHLGADISASRPVAQASR